MGIGGDNVDAGWLGRQGVALALHSAADVLRTKDLPVVMTFLISRALVIFVAFLKIFTRSLELKPCFMLNCSHLESVEVIGLVFYLGVKGGKGMLNKKIMLTLM